MCIIIISILNRLIGNFFKRTEYDQTVEIFIQRGFSTFLWIIFILLILANLGIDVTAFVAGLGIVGFVVGFATKDILSNLAAGIMLVFNKPFKVGDHVEVYGIDGNVKEINISFSLIETGNEIVYVPNSRVWGNPIRNFSKIISK